MHRGRDIIIIMEHKQTIRKLKSRSNSITFSELASLLESLGFHQDNKGRTSGSRVKFLNKNGVPIYLHKPHPRKTLLAYQVKEVVEILKEENIL